MTSKNTPCPDLIRLKWGHRMRNSSAWIKQPTIIGLLLTIMLACSLSSSLPPSNNSKVQITNKETTLQDLLKNSQHVLVLVDGYSGNRGIYWLDLEHGKLYLAKLPETKGTFIDGTYTWVPERNMSVWNGSEFVYGDRIAGFFSLSPNGTSQKLSSQGYIGRLAYNGEQILRFRNCGEDDIGSSYIITSLDQVMSPASPCFFPGNFRTDDETWKFVEPVWNPSLPCVDYIVSERYGRGDQLRVTSNKLVRSRENGGLVEIIDLGIDFNILGGRIIPRPDGLAFYIRGNPPDQSTVIDANGNLLVDLSSTVNRFPGKHLNEHFSWSPTGEQAVFFIEDCKNEQPCTQTIILTDNKFQELKEIVTLPAGFQFDSLIWSPHGDQIALIKEIHEGSKKPPRIYTIDLLDQAVHDYIFPMESILQNVQWIQ